jgi:uncharacterized protein (DUF1697 family)
MFTYIALLRGINVSGQKSVKMTALIETFRKLGFNNVKTYLQSGNVIFTSAEQDTSILARKTEQEIKKDFGHDVPVIVLEVNTLKQIIEANPFAKDTSKEISYMHVTFLSSKPHNMANNQIEDKKQGNEEIVFTDNAIYLYCPHGYGNTKLNNNFLETKLKIIATTRNWKTTNELYRLALG